MAAGKSKKIPLTNLKVTKLYLVFLYLKHDIISTYKHSRYTRDCYPMTSHACFLPDSSVERIHSHIFAPIIKQARAN